MQQPDLPYMPKRKSKASKKQSESFERGSIKCSSIVNLSIRLNENVAIQYKEKQAAYKGIHYRQAHIANAGQQ